MRRMKKINIAIKAFVGHKPGVALFAIICVLLSSCSATVVKPIEEKKNAAWAIEDEFGISIKSKDEPTKIYAYGQTELYLNGKTNQFMIKNTGEDTSFFSFPTLTESSTQVDGINASIEFINNTGSRTIYTTQNDAIAYNQYYYMRIDRGIRVTYLFGKKKIIRLVPYAISKDRMEKLILNGLDDFSKTLINTYYSFVSLKDIDSEMDKAVLEQKYPSLKNGDLYVLGKSSADNLAISDLMLETVEEIIKQTKYSLQDLEVDNSENFINVDDSKSKNIQMSLDLCIENGDLTVTIPREGLLYEPSQIRIINMEVLPFFGASTKDGFMMIPDGSGAIINFNNGKTKYDSYRKPIYGEDKTEVKKVESPDAEAKISLPVFGMKTDTGSFIGIVEKGDTAGFVNASIAGKNSPVNRAYASFQLCSVTPMEFVVVGSSANAYQKNPYNDDIKIRFRFMNRDSGYVEMAQNYKNYLKSLRQVNNEPYETAVSVDFIGGITDVQSVLGYPVKTILPLTKYTQAMDIVKELQKAGMGKAAVQFSYWANNGIENTSAMSVETISQLGGSRGFELLKEYIQSNAMELYPVMEFLYVNKIKAGDSFQVKKFAARKTTDEMAYRQYYNIATLEPLKDKKSHIVSAVSFPLLFQRFEQSFAKYKIKSISLGNMGTDLNSDFRKDATYDRESTKNKVIAELKTLKDKGYKMMFDGCNSYVLPFASSVSDLPLNSSGNYLFDASVPFCPIVLTGWIPCYSESLNTSSDYQRDLLKCIETGVMPKFDLMYRRNSDLKETEYNFYGLYYKDWLSDIKDASEIFTNTMKLVQNQEIMGHKQVSNGVFCTTYANERQVYVNYNKVDQPMDGFVVKAMSYYIK